MTKILVIGAGRSSSTLIEYLLRNFSEHSWEVTIADSDIETAKSKTGGMNARVLSFDFNDIQQRETEISRADIVLSMLPMKFHPEVARLCVNSNKHLLTASYATEEIKKLDAEAKDKGILLLNECGLDPGIDHMSAMKVIDRIRNNGGHIVGFESFTGGLLAPNDNVDNPWQYKFTWNPRNVVLAGTGGVKFLQEGRYKYIPHHKIFRRTEVVHIPGYGYFEGYANRDSLGYRHVYGLDDIRTMYRGTFRRQGFCKAWNIFVQLGACDDSYVMEEVGKMTHRQFINSFLSFNPDDSIELKLAHYMNLDLESDEMNKLKWAGFFSDEPVGLDKGTPAQILEHILKKVWTLDPDEQDMIVMWHKFTFQDSDKIREIHATMVAVGDDRINTAMSKTVGLPMGIATKLIATGKIRSRGVKIPIEAEIYEPVLSELNKEGFVFIEEEIKPKKK
jgi:saccharopine dehydrogenase (NADP+, L-glutamate forming)